MSLFEVHQCTNPVCGLRIPIDPEVNKGAYCPRCGASMSHVVEPYRHQGISSERQGKFKLEILLDNIRSAYNVGAVFRTADGAGAKHLYLCGITPNPRNNPSVGKTALGAEDQIPWSYHPNAYWLAQELREKGYRLLGLECTEEAVTIHQFRLEEKGEQPIVLIIGNEQAGVDPGLIALCENVLAIPMVGRKASLNVEVALGIAVYWLAFGSERNEK